VSDVTEREGCFLILHGFTGSGPDHWQSWLADRLARDGRDVRYPDLPDPDHPEIGRWLDALNAELATLDPARLVVLAHSAGALLWLHHAARTLLRSASRVLLVAPPGPSWRDPAVTGFIPVPLDADGVRTAAGETRIVAGDDDPYGDIADVRDYALTLGVPIDVIPGGGHLNTVSGHGPWPDVERWALDGGALAG
jgi:uncharacterized protein